MALVSWSFGKRSSNTNLQTAKSTKAENQPKPTQKRQKLKLQIFEAVEFYRRVQRENDTPFFNSQRNGLASCWLTTRFLCDSYCCKTWWWMCSLDFTALKQDAPFCTNPFGISNFLSRREEFLSQICEFWTASCHKKFWRNSFLWHGKTTCRYMRSIYEPQCISCGCAGSQTEQISPLRNASVLSHFECRLHRMWKRKESAPKKKRKQMKIDDVIVSDQKCIHTRHE